jgi:prephenate dehydrogenase
MHEPPVLTRVGIAGLGLIGGSVALAIRRAWPSAHVIGFDQQAACGEEAVRLGAVDVVAGTLGELAAADLIVLAQPLPVVIESIPALVGLDSAAVVTDVGSTKRLVMAAAAGSPSFVGGHPMAGSERSGLAHARADMFEGRPWLLVRGRASERAATLVEGVVSAVGARPRWIDVEDHDRTVAYVSHLPQVLSVALMNAVVEAIGEDHLDASGRAFSEMTRLAGSPPDMWRAVLAQNADFVAEALSHLVEHLPAAPDLTRGKWVSEVFDRAAAARARKGE